MDLTRAQFTEIVGREMGSVLMRPPLADSDDFFLAGGDSLRAVALITQLVSRWHPTEGEEADRLRNALLLGIFENATPEYLADLIGAEQ
ncbi:phosphopantetheine-binding protein [Micromonospora sp. CPCC 205539]|uniref:phosphopantetheine-binding protein n=1 Tax=Micromonospora sp. CPCC 205539 TaxID=3122408 RepID=UPI002FF2A07B